MKTLLPAFLIRSPLEHLCVAMLCLLPCVLVPAPALGQEPEGFQIEDVRVEGLSRIVPGTVFNYLPFKVGDFFNEEDSALAIRALYQTGFFDDVRIEREGDTLVVIVLERPVIGAISVSGNESIETEDMLEGLLELGFAEGRVFDRSQLDRIQQELVRQYFAQGRYAVQVDYTVTDLEPEGRVSIAIDIFEGEAANIRRINLVGNNDFDEDDLLDEFESTPGGIFSFFTKDNQYSRQKLAGDLETLRSYYLDRGYMRFSIDSTQVSISPDRESIYVTINLTEGGQYKIADISLAGQFVVPTTELFGLVDVSRGELFSRKRITGSGNRISERLGQEGYAFANVNPIPEIDDESKTVDITLFVEPGRRSYVRRIIFAGNERTRDEVLRREMRQQEGAWISTSKVDRGRVRLQRLGYFPEVNVETRAVPGTDDQVDVQYSVTEGPAGTLLLGLGFSQNRGLILRLSVTQDNFLGSGNRVSLAFNNSAVNRRFSLSYLNPYYTIDGIRRGFHVSYSDLDASEANISDYNAQVLGTGVNFGIPISEYNLLGLDLAYEQTDLELGSAVSTRVRQFVEEEGSRFNVLKVTGSFAYDTRNRAILPDRGTLQRISLEVGTPGLSNSVNFFKLDYRSDWLIPLSELFTLLLEGEVGYGDGYGGTSRLPFFEHFYLGGPRSLRGYEENTVGPLDASNNALGGNMKTFFSSELILPIPFIKKHDQVRATLFVDAGNVYDLREESLDLSEFRYSAGLSGIWVSPVGVLSASYAFPFGDKPGDRIQSFQFTFGASF